MCFGINFNGQNLSGISLTAAYLMTATVDFRNGHKNMGIPETIARRVVGALCLAGCIVAALVEHVVRIPLLLLAAVVFLAPCLDNGGLKPALAVVVMALLSLPTAVDLALRNINAFVQNIYKQQIDINTLHCCELIKFS